MPSKCVKCGQEHKTSDCTKTTDEKATCANCGGEHTANYKGCKCHKDARKTTQDRTNSRKEFKLTKEQFPRINNSTEATPPQTSTWGPKKKEEDTGSLTDVLKLFKDLNLKDIFTTIKATMAKVAQAQTSLEKVMVIAEALLQFF